MLAKLLTSSAISQSFRGILAGPHCRNFVFANLFRNAKFLSTHPDPNYQATVDNIASMKLAGFLAKWDPPEHLRSLKFSEHSLGRCEMEALLRGMRSNTTVESLEFEENTLGSDGAILLQEMLLDNTNLRHLSLNEAEMGPAGLARVLEAIGENKALWSFWMTNEDVSDAAAEHLAKSLSRNKVLKSIALENCSLTLDGLRRIAGALESHRSIQALRLSYNSNLGFGGDALASLLDKNKGLRSLDVTGVLLGQEAAKLVHNCTLEELWLGLNLIDDVAAENIANNLCGCTSLKVLDLWNNNMSCDGVAKIARALQDSKLTSLSLVHNNVGVQGLEAVAALTSLQELDLSRCLLQGDEHEGYAIADILRSCTSLRVLRLGFNELGEDALRALSPALADCSLSELDLSGNNVTPAALQYITEPLSSNRSLKRLILEANPIGDEGAVALSHAIKENKTLEYLDLYNTHVSDVGASAIVKELENERDRQGTVQVNLGMNPISSELANNMTLRGLEKDIPEDIGPQG